MNQTFAGFWRDGAVVEPEEKHSDGGCDVIVKVKEDNRLELFHINGGCWDKVYWLDTTMPTELSPQEAFELLKIMFPMLTGIEKDRQRDYTMNGDRYIEASINWGDTTEYPLKKKWRVPNDSDKGKRCRFRDDVNKDWAELEGAKFICTWQDGFLIEYARVSPTSWRYCEVLDEAA